MGLLLLIILGCASAILVSVGWEGYRIGNSPYCKRCKYNLTGIKTENSKCPECGATLSRSAVIYGKHEIRPIPLMVGSVGLLVCIGLYISSFVGWLSMDRFIKIIPTRILITYTIKEPVVWFSRDGYFEIIRRIDAGALDAQEQTQLVDALLDRLPNAKPAEINMFGTMLSEYVHKTSSGRQGSTRIADFLYSMWFDGNHIWVATMTNTLFQLHQEGYLSDSSLDDIQTSALTSHIWTDIRGPLRPGDDFIIGCRFETRGLERFAGAFFNPLIQIHIDLPAAFEIKEYIQPGFYSDDNRVGYTPTTSLTPIAIVHVRSSPYKGSIGVRVVDVSSSSLTQKDTTSTTNKPTQEVQSSNRYIPIIVTDNAANGDSTIKSNPTSRLQNDLLPASWNNNYSMFNSPHRYNLVVPLLEKVSCSGELRAVEPDGTVQILGSFTCTDTQSSWFGTDGSSCESVFELSNSQPFIEMRIPRLYVHPSSVAKLVLSFDQVRWDDGMAKNSDLPIDIDLPIDFRTSQPLW